MTALLIGLLLLAGCGGREAPVTGTSFLMDTIVEYKLYGKNAQAARTRSRRSSRGSSRACRCTWPDSEVARAQRKRGEGVRPPLGGHLRLLSRCAAFGEASAARST